MINTVSNIIRHALMALYQPFWFSVLMAVLIMFFYISAKQKGVKAFIKEWVGNFRHSPHFRRLLFFSFYTVLILFRTLLNRNIWENPLINVIGVWGLYDSEGQLTTEIIENMMIFIPFTFLLIFTFKNKFKFNHSICLIFKATAVTFAFSLSIEFLQLFLRVGTLQLSDLFFNTLGGLIGAVIYVFSAFIYKLIKKDKI